MLGRRVFSLTTFIYSCLNCIDDGGGSGGGLVMMVIMMVVVVVHG